MSLPIDDILLTSYALGELEGDDLARVESELATNAAARERVAELRSLAALLGDELGGQAAPGLDAGRRAAIEAAAGGDRPRGILLRMDARPWAAAAAILLAFGGALGFGLRGEKDEAREVARNETPAPVQNENGRLDRDLAGSKDQDLRRLGNEVREARDQVSLDELLTGRETLKKPAEAEKQILRVELGQRQGVSVVVPNEKPQADSPTVGLVATDGVRAGTTTITPGSGPGPVGGGAPGGATGGSKNGPTGSPFGPGSPPPVDGRANSDAIGGGAGGRYTGPPNRADGYRRARKKDVAPERSATAAESYTAPAAEADVDAVRPADRSNELAAIEGKIALLESEAAKLPKSKKVLVDRLIGDVTAHSRELASRSKGMNELRATNASKEELLEVQKAELSKSVGELEAKFEHVRRFVDDELRRAGNEDYSTVVEQPFKMALTEPLSTIGLDVDTASYANVRRFLNGGSWPPRDAVRVDEMVNYFRYADPAPEGEENVAVHAEVAACPWNLDNRLLRVAFKAKEIARDARGATSLVFLVDVSGSMRSSDKLPLLKEGLKKLTEQLGEDDSVAIVTYASGVSLRLEPTFGNDQAKILGVLDSLNAGGSTNGAGGIQMAYEVAARAFVSGGTNRVILCTDGDFNVGVSDTDELTRMIEEKAKGGVFLSVLGFGTGNLKDGRMQALANKGNGHYAYIDSGREAQKVLVEELAGTLVTVAKDAKLQVEFNPAEVSSWRLLGYSARILQAQDFNDDRKDAGEIGAGHSVVALYEIRPTHGAADGAPAVDPLKYQKKPVVANRGEPGEIATVKLRYKMPEAEKSRLRTVPVIDDGRHYGAAGVDFKLSASVALFGQLLARSSHVGQTSLEAAHELALESIGPDNDPRGLRRELGELIKKAIALRNAMNPQGGER